MFRYRTLIAAAIAGLALMGSLLTGSALATKAAKGHHGACRGKSCKAKPGASCKKGKVKKSGKCVKKQPAEPAEEGEETGLPPLESITPAAGEPSATLIVHVLLNGEPDESTRLEVLKRVSAQTPIVGSLETAEHTLHVKPGYYEIRALSVTSVTIVSYTAPQRVTVAAGQQAEVKLEFQ